MKGENQLFVYYLYGNSCMYFFFFKVWLTNIFFMLDVCSEVV